MVFQAIAQNFYQEDGDPCVHESLFGRKTPEVEAAFALYLECEHISLHDIRRTISGIVSDCDPYLLRQSAQWDELNAASMQETARLKRERANKIDQLMRGTAEARIENGKAKSAC